jgi:Nif-specific regulatory protein
MGTSRTAPPGQERHGTPVLEGSRIMSATDLGVGSARERPGRSAEIALYGVYEISKFLTTPARLEVTLTQVLRLLSSFLDMRDGLIALLDAAGALELVADSSGVPERAKSYFARLPEQVIGRVVVTQMPLVVESVRDDPLFDGCSIAGFQGSDVDISFIGVPIKDRGRVVGTLTIDRERGAGEDPEFRFDHDVRFLTMVANLLGQTVRLHRALARDRGRLMQDQHRLEKALEHQSPQGSDTQPLGIVGESPALLAVLEKVRLVARSHSTVMLRGESGTGKELFARALHEMSPRKHKPFVTVNCAALPESVLESELFGHERGAFTGATGQRKGRFELADGGTLFLDEIGEISAGFQAKLLRVLQLGEFERVGGASTLKVDVRLVGATNRDLEQAVAQGEFRADLYYRLAVVPILLPPLRERVGDIPLLAREFLAHFNAENGTALDLAPAAFSVLTACCFPGNVRELENCVRRTATLAPGPEIVADDFACRHDECLSSMLWKRPHESITNFVPLPIGRGPRRASLASPSQPAPADVAEPAVADDESWEMPALAGDESGKSDRERLIEVMEAVGWVQAKAARMLGLTPRQVGYALRKYDIAVKKF